MKKILAKSLLVIIEAGFEVLAERIKEKRKKNEHSDGLNSVRAGRRLPA
jgi:deoxyadenosine/deoxycytidine kinase